MMFKIVCVYDLKTESYSPPFFVRAHGHAVRSFTDEVNNAESQLNKHPEDYALYSVGEFDDTSGVVNGSPPVLLARGSDLLSS